MLRPRHTPPATIPQPYRATARSRTYPKTAGERLVIKSVPQGRRIKSPVAITDPSEPTPLHAMTSMSRMQTSPGKMARIGSASRLTLLAIRSLRSCRTSPQPALHYRKKPESPESCGRDEGRAWQRGGNPHSSFFLGRCPVACCRVLHSGRLESCSSILEALSFKFSNLSRSAATTSSGARVENSPSSKRSKRVI